MADQVIAFGAGDVFLIPSGSNPTPQRIAQLQSVSVEISEELKKLYGNRKFPIAQVAARGSITGKAKAAVLDAAFIASVGGGNTTTGQNYGVVEESHAAAASVDVANKTTWVEDLGVTDKDGKRMTCGATATAVGTYAVAAGAYSFHASETGNVKISYRASLTTGRKVLVTNQLVGTAITYTLELFNTEPGGEKVGLKLYSVTIPKLSFAFQTDDFTMPDVDFEAGADSSNNVYEWYLP